MAPLIITAMCFFSSCAEPPNARAVLNKMIESRKAFATADVRWVQSSSEAAPRCHRSRIDGAGNWTFERVPDPDGIVLPSQVGKPRSCSAERILSAGGKYWQAFEHSAIIYEISPRMPSIDIRSVGLAPEVRSNTAIEDVLAPLINNRKDEDFTLKEEEEGVVAVRMKQSPTDSVTWWIDTKRGYNPIKIERVVDGKVAGRVVSSLAQYDHVWFPKKVTCTRDDVRQATLAFDIEQAEFDRPNHPSLLNLFHIGAVPYNVIQLRKSQQVAWNGADFISLVDLRRMVAEKVIPRGDLQPWVDRVEWCTSSGGGRYPAWQSDSSYGAKPCDIDEWEKYVRRFCLIRKCDDRQKASAKGILDDCRKAATPLMSRIRQEQAKEKDAAKKEAMLAPISDIFAKSLVPRLEALLTIPQSQPTSKPVEGVSGATPKS